VTTPNFLHVFGTAPSDLQLCFVQLKTLAPFARYSTFKYPMTLKPWLGVTQGHRKYTCRSDTHDLLLTFHSSHRPISHRFRDKRQFPSKIANFSYPPCIYSPWWRGSPCNLVSAQRVPNASMMGLPDGRKGFKVGLVVLIQYWLWQTDTQPARHVAVASTRYAYLRRAVKTIEPIFTKFGQRVAHRERKPIDFGGNPDRVTLGLG